MKTLTMIISLLSVSQLTLASGDFDAASFIAGKCSSCHDETVYTRPNHRMQNLEQLEKQVRFCDTNVGTGLFNEDIKEVTNYLDRQYYHFSQ